VRGETCVCVRTNAISPTRAARFGSSRWKALWFVRGHGSKPTVAEADLTRRRWPAQRKACRRAHPKRGVESELPGTSRDRGRQRFVRPVRLPQPMGAGGQRPTRVPSGDLRAAPRRSGLKLPRLKAVLLDEESAARTVPIHRREPTAYEDAAQRRKRSAGGSLRPRGRTRAPPGRPGLTHPSRPFGRREPPQHARGASVASFVRCRSPAAGPVVRATERSRPDDTGFHRDSFGPLRPAQHDVDTSRCDLGGC